MTNQNNGKYLPRNRKGRKNSPVSRILLVVALVSALIFAGTVFIALRNQIALKRMAAETARETTPISTSAPAETTVPTQATVPPTTAATVPPTEPREVLPRLLELYEKNPDLAGWLTIPGTRIDYPVMYSPDEPERYLHANFEASLQLRRASLHSTRPVTRKAATASSMPTTCWTAACSARC